MKWGKEGVVAFSPAPKGKGSLWAAKKERGEKKESCTFSRRARGKGEGEGRDGRWRKLGCAFHNHEKKGKRKERDHLMFRSIGIERGGPRPTSHVLSQRGIRRARKKKLPKGRRRKGGLRINMSGIRGRILERTSQGEKRDIHLHEEGGKKKGGGNLLFFRVPDV